METIKSNILYICILYSVCGILFFIFKLFFNASFDTFLTVFTIFIMAFRKKNNLEAIFLSAVTNVLALFLCLLIFSESMEAF